MIIRRHDIGYHFWGDTDSGMTMRWGKTLYENPMMFAPWPELADISISNYCTKGCTFCYQDSTEYGDFMSLSDYKKVLDALCDERWGSVFQVALGGGEPLEHPDLLSILKVTREKGIIPNLTTNGVHVTETIAKKIKPLIGAIAVTVLEFSSFNWKAVDILVRSDIKTNLHFVLSNETIDGAISLLSGKYNELLEGVNAILFLTYKPKGRATAEKCLKNNESLQTFLELVDHNKCSVRIGFDACFVPLLLHNTECNPDFVDSCECGFFSIYIDEKKNVKPCSFSIGDLYTYNLEEYSFAEIWKDKLEDYRKVLLEEHVCKLACKNHSNCRGNCMYFKELSLCV